MRVTKTRLMRSKTINPNPPICRSKEPSLTVINIYSCATNELLKRIEHYNWNLSQAQAAANGGPGTYTTGYFYEAAFSKYTSLDQRHCPPRNWLAWGNTQSPPPYHMAFIWQAFNENTGVGGIGSNQPEILCNYTDPALYQPIDISYFWDPSQWQIAYNLNSPCGKLFVPTPSIDMISGYTPVPPEFPNFIETEPPP